MLEKKRITVMVIGTDPSRQKSFYLSRPAIWLTAAVFTVVLMLIAASYIYLIPKAMEYNSLTGELSRMAGNTTQLVEVLEDFRKMQDLNRYVRNMLGIRQVFIDDSGDYVYEDSLGYFEMEEQNPSQITVLENIPNTMPVNGVITQDFDDSGRIPEDNHYGIDIAGREGSAVNAAAGGLVVYSGWDDNYGNIIILDHGDKYYTMYGHNSVNLVRLRERVKRGQRIALLGNSGRSTGPHLHFEIWNDGIAVDPVNYISEYRQE